MISDAVLEKALSRLRPRMTAYIPPSHKPTPKQRAFLCLPHYEAMFGGALGAGKALTYDCPVLTPWGWKPIGELKVGSKVSATDGTVTHVIGVYPQGKRPCYKLTWHNGATTICDENHIWLAWVTGKSRKKKNKRSHARDAARKWTTDEIFKRFHELKTINGSQRFAIPVIDEPVAYNVHGENRGPNLHLTRDLIPPYVLGALLGDGCVVSRAHLHSADEEIADIISDDIGREVKPHKFSIGKSCQSYPLHDFIKPLKLLGVLGCRSWEKFIPRIYKYGSVEERWSLLQGLMDTDGWVESDGGCYFTSTSKQLADDVAEVASSLGAVTFKRRKTPKYTHKGQKKEGRVAFTVRIKIPDSTRLFRLRRKKELATAEPQSMALYLSKIEKIGKRDTVCIQVAHPNSLFIIDDFVVTHNTDVLLMAALQFVDVPGYNALIIRKTLADAKMPSSILFRARQWLGHTDAIWKGDEHTWYFPSGATLKFGKLAQIGDAQTYQGSEFSFLAYDESTQLLGSDMEYVSTRLRHPQCPHHKEPDWRCQVCHAYGMVSKVPLRIRSATNPGGVSHMYVKQRYQIEAIPGKTGPTGKPLYAGTHPKRVHVPAFIHDNPFIDKDAYIDRLSDLTDPVTRDQLLSGDWGVTVAGRFKLAWKRFYKTRRNFVEMIDGGSCPESHLETFLIIDPAASRDATPGTEELKKKGQSYTAMGVMSATPDGHLLIRYAERHQQEIPHTKHAIRRLYQMFPEIRFVGMELSSLSTHFYQMLANEGFNMKAFTTGGRDKLARSAEATNRMESGRIWFPEEQSEWQAELDAEIFTWTGDPDQTDDQVDWLCYGGIYMSQRASGRRGRATPVAVM